MTRDATGHVRVVLTVRADGADGVAAATGQLLNYLLTCGGV
jgi:hypothetical protein